jgi:hypothetical protein
MSSRFRRRLGKHTWRSTGRGDVLTSICLVCRKTRERHIHAWLSKKSCSARPCPVRGWVSADAVTLPAEAPSGGRERVSVELEHDGQTRALLGGAV